MCLGRAYVPAASRGVNKVGWLGSNEVSPIGTKLGELALKQRFALPPPTPSISEDVAASWSHPPQGRVGSSRSESSGEGRMSATTTTSPESKTVLPSPKSPCRPGNQPEPASSSPARHEATRSFRGICRKPVQRMEKKSLLKPRRGPACPQSKLICLVKDLL